MKIQGRTLYPGSIFFEECWERLLELDDNSHSTILQHTDAAFIGHELLLASEFCEDFEMRQLALRFRFPPTLWFDFIRRYRFDVVKFLKERKP